MEAFAPGSVTALFAPSESATGSVGVSFATEDGVVASVEPAAERRVSLDGSPTAFEPVALAVEALGVTAAVDLTAEVPVGRGFGASGAATLATALAANETFDLGRSREALVGVAFEAEVEAGTGLGDVFVQDRGGLVVGDGTGVERHERTTPVEYESYGGIDTSEALGDAALMERVTEAGTAGVADLPAEPSLAEVTEAGWAFAREVGLPTGEVAETVARVEAAGGAASMAMVGETVFAVGVEGELDGRTAVSPGGARLLGPGEG